MPVAGTGYWPAYFVCAGSLACTVMEFQAVQKNGASLSLDEHHEKQQAQEGCARHLSKHPCLQAPAQSSFCLLSCVGYTVHAHWFAV